ncbi:MAG: tripartite tricarboxylate transporter substrate binding protein [Polynucleobacter sp.]|jgi:tripartite-type tricarboxylate transporter receptor subunit TctC|nr:tripartite tricarboxylate transporter substrate binding protein [Polynucleobacter sp.]NQW59063.1 tripartite tricarboxylate transporter substrate binding protein [Polynucleobacter sp.]
MIYRFMSMIGLGIILLSNAVFAQRVMNAEAVKDYPNRPIRMILPNAPGSSNDVLGRIFATKLGEVIGQQVVVENHAGAAGLIGMEMAKSAQADGYTIISTSPASMTILPNIRKKLNYDPLGDYQFVSLYAVLPNMLVVNPSLPIQTVQDLIKYCNANPEKVYVASAGPGSQSHLASLLMQVSANFSSIHVPYKGGGASVLAVMTGEAQWTITPASSVMGHVRNGKLRAVAHSLSQRSQLMGDIPTVGETIPGFSYSAWNGIVMPKGVPIAIVDKFRVSMIKTLNMTEVKDLLGKQGAEAFTNTPEQFRTLVQTELESTAKVVKVSNLTID